MIAVHFALALSPAASFLIPEDIRFLPVVFAANAVSLGQLMLLSFWTGMGPGKLTRRLIATFCGVVYVGLWQEATTLLMSEERGSAIARSLARVSTSFAIVVLFAGVFLAMRRWFAELRPIDDAEESPERERFQYSMLSALVVVSLVAIVMGLTRSARTGGSLMTTWQLVPLMALTLTTFFVNSVCAVWAALGAGRVGLRITLVMLVASLLGIAVSIAASQDKFAWWFTPSMMLAMTVPSIVVITSLLVVRSCGYRMVQKVARRN